MNNSASNINTPPQDLANAIRFLTVDAVQSAQSGHPGMPMGMADVATVLFKDFLRFNPDMPDWHNRDRFVLSAGHGSMLLYSLLYLTGYPACDLEQIKNFRQFGFKTAGHPEHGLLPGIETTTGPLGQGLANAVGMALAERMLNARWGDALINHHTYVIAGDGCLMEGISQEAISFAGHLQLSKLIVLFDDNGITIDGKTSLSTSDNTKARFQACGFETVDIDGHDADAIHRAISNAKQSDKPSLICCKTHIGYGSPNKQDSSTSHGAPLGEDEIALTRKALNWSHPPFVIPDNILQGWRAIGRQHKQESESSAQALAQLPADKKALWQVTFQHDFEQILESAIQNIKQQWQQEIPKLATRKSSEFVLNQLYAHLPHLVGGSADLSGSNNTKTKQQTSITADNFNGNYINYGIREHAMGAMMNGLALHGGLLPYGGTFLVFSDYMRPAIRLSALMRQKVIYVLTHDSIGVGEDGPTHQPVEHVPSLRAIPELLVLRPADALEVAECWQIALRHQGASALILTRHDLPGLGQDDGKGVNGSRDFAQNSCQQGGYIISDALSNARDYQLTIIASGSEVCLAVSAQALLAQDNIQVRVVSMPCRELFDQLPKAQQQAILGDKIRFAVEAAIPQGWAKYGVDEDKMIAMRRFGEAGPSGEIFAHFGFTAENIAEKVKEILI